jgi:hypothetical protein
LKRQRLHRTLFSDTGGGMSIIMKSAQEFRRFSMECAAMAVESDDMRLRNILFQTSRLCSEAALLIDWPCEISDDDNPPLVPR